jgi:hypothetical protein
MIRNKRKNKSKVVKEFACQAKNKYLSCSVADCSHSMYRHIKVCGALYWRE